MAELFRFGGARRTKSLRASATTSGQAPSHSPTTSPVSCDVTERQRRFVATKCSSEIAPRFRHIGIPPAIPLNTAPTRWKQGGTLDEC